MRRTSVVVATVAVAASTLGFGSAASPSGATISPSHPVVRWAGGPINGAPFSPDECNETSCDAFVLSVAVPSSHWQRHPGGIVVGVVWDDPASDVDLSVYDSTGQEIARSGRFQGNAEQAYLPTPPPGTYRVVVYGDPGNLGARATDVTYRGEASLVRHRVKSVVTPSTSLRFAQTLVDPQHFAMEPNIWAGDDGRIFAAGILGVDTTTSYVWRSDDDGATFQLLDARLGPSVVDPRGRPCTESGGGGDLDVVSDRTGRVYLADLEAAQISVGISTDKGNSWRCNAVAASTPEEDRPWLAPAPTADGEGPNVDAYLGYRDLFLGVLPGGEAIKPFQLHIDATRDGGRTWTQGATFARGVVDFSGPIFTSPDGTLYNVFKGGNSVWMARSSDEGRTFSLHRVSTRLAAPQTIWVGGDADASGNVYAAWVDPGTFDVVYSYSTDKGDRWSLPVRVSPPASDTSIMPWVAAGAPGDVAIAWYGSSRRGLPDDVPAGEPWYAWIARSVRATSPSPDFQTARMSATPMHFGPVCVMTDCGSGRLADFFEIDIARNGAVVAAFNDNGRIPSPDGEVPGPYVVVARQVGGVGLTRASARAASHLSEPRGDALFPPHSANSRNVASLDLGSVPKASLVRGAIRISFSLPDIALNPGPGDAGLATDSYFIAIWKAHRRVEYAGMRLGGASPAFFGGDEPVGVVHPISRADDYASYPATFALEGGVDLESRHVFIDVPLALYHLHDGDRLYGLQVFAMTGASDLRTALTLLQVLDATPAVHIAIGEARSRSASYSRRPTQRAVSRVLAATGVASTPLALLMLGAAAALAVWWCSPAVARRRSH